MFDRAHGGLSVLGAILALCLLSLVYSGRASSISNGCPPGLASSISNGCPAAAVAQVGATQAGFVSGNGTVTTSAINTTGATLLVVTITAGAFTPHVSDSNNNTWNGLNSNTVPGGPFLAILYSYSNAGGPLVTGAGHTVSITNSSSPFFTWSAWSGTYSGTTNPYDSVAGQPASMATASTLQPGSITPVNGALVITTLAEGNIGCTGATVGAPYTTSTGADFITGSHYGNWMGFLLPSTGVATNSTWTITTGSCGLAATVASFKKLGT